MATDINRGMLSEEPAAHSWAVILRGVAAVIFGLLAIVWPGISLIVLLVLFGVYAIVDGILAIAAGVATHQFVRRWWALVVVGIIGIAAGVVAFAYPGITIIALLSIIAIWAIVTGVLQIVAAVVGPAVMEHRWLWGISGALSLIFGILLFSYPIAGILAVAWLIGFYAIIFGVTQISLGAQITSAQHGMRSAMQH